MSALAVRHDLDWTGLIVVLGILAVTLVVTWAETRDWWRRQDLELQRIIDEALALANEVDHVDCANPDCDRTICACRKPAECTGCTTLGCSHGEELCWDCRLGCTACAAEEQVLRDLDWAAGR